MRIQHTLRSRSRGSWRSAIALHILAAFAGGLSFARANDLTIANLSVTGQNRSAHCTYVQFDIAWENSWRFTSAPGNRDAAWVFVKYKAGSGPWRHATLNTTGHTAPSGSTIETPSDGKGVFIYRSTDGSGTFGVAHVQLRWNYGADGVADDSIVTVRAFATEMVYIPSGSFYAGSGGSESGAFYTYPLHAAPFLISSEDTISVGAAIGSLYYDRNIYPGDQAGPVPSAFPKGTQGLYCMKYEISQKQYADFLNCLAYAQQVTRTAASPDAPAGTIALTTAANVFRNGIRVQTPGISPVTPAVYACDFSGDGVFDQPNDGQNIACNWLSWADGAAYADWAGLRPMSELEYEKICRGTAAPVPNEYCWGSTAWFPVSSIVNPGRPDEGPGNAGANVICFDNAYGNSMMRVGCAANSSTVTREASGATYYGVMNMSDNLFERCVTVGQPAGRNFTARHGDGSLDSLGNADVATWPDSTADGSCFRGGFWYNENNPNPGLKNRVSDRYWGSYGDPTRLDDWGFRCVRSLP